MYNGTVRAGPDLHIGQDNQACTDETTGCGSAALMVGHMDEHVPWSDKVDCWKTLMPRLIPRCPPEQMRSSPRPHPAHSLLPSLPSYAPPMHTPPTAQVVNRQGKATNAPGRRLVAAMSAPSSHLPAASVGLPNASDLPSALALTTPRRRQHKSWRALSVTEIQACSPVPEAPDLSQAASPGFVVSEQPPGGCRPRPPSAAKTIACSYAQDSSTPYGRHLPFAAYAPGLLLVAWGKACPAHAAEDS
jgi:hypothetical protein